MRKINEYLRLTEDDKLYDLLVSVYADALNEKKYEELYKKHLKDMSRKKEDFKSYVNMSRKSNFYVSDSYRVLFHDIISLCVELGFEFELTVSDFVPIGEWIVVRGDFKGCGEFKLTYLDYSITKYENNVKSLLRLRNGLRNMRIIKEGM